MSYRWSFLRSALVLPLASLSACAPMQLATGCYTETRGPGVVLLTGQTLCLAANHTFAYPYWSDNVSSSYYGQGVYHLRGNKLHLRFEAVPPAAATTVARPLVTPPDSLYMKFLVLARSPAGGASPAPLPYATIAAHAESGNAVASAMSDTAGFAVLRVPRGTRWLSVQSLGFGIWRQECPPSSTTYRLELPANQGTPYAAGTSKVLHLVRQQSPRTLLVEQGAARIVFKREPSPE